MIDKMNPLYFKGVRPIPVIPTVYTDALSYGEQLGIIGHKTDECVETVNEVVDDNNEFKADLTEQQTEFEGDMTTWKEGVDTDLSDWKRDTTADLNQWKNDTTDGLNTWKTDTKAEYKAQIDGMEADYNEFLAEYEATYGVSQHLGNNTLDVISQAGTTQAIYTRANHLETLLDKETIDFTLDKFIVDRYDYAYNAQSGYVEAEGWNTIKIDIPKTLLFYMTNVSSGTIIVVWNGTERTNISTTDITNGRYISANTSLYISSNGSDDTKHIIITDYKDRLDYPRYYVAKDKISSGVALNNGTVVQTATGNTAIQKIYVNEMTLKHDIGDYNTNGCAFDENDTYLGQVTKIGGRILTYPYGTKYILFTTGKNNIISYDLQTAELKKKYYAPNSVDKDFSFENSTILGIGDSIMVGYYDAESHYDKAFLKLFCDKVGAYHFNNRGIGGSTFTTNLETHTVIEQLESVTLNAYDYIFIACGTNDYGRRADISQMQSDMNTVSSYITSHAKATAKVIVITPFGRTVPNDGPSAPFDEYRQAINDWALSKGYTVLNGKDLGISGIAGSYMTAVTEDGLHPNELGHQIIARALCGYLL